MLLDSVLFLFSAEPFPNVVPSVNEFGGSIFDGDEVGVMTVEGVNVSLESVIVTHDNVIVDAVDLMVFLYDLKPTGCDLMNEVGEFVYVDVVSLCVREKIVARSTV